MWLGTGKWLISRLKNKRGYEGMSSFYAFATTCKREEGRERGSGGSA